MKSEIGIWKIERDARTEREPDLRAERLDHSRYVETELMLEDILVANPEMLTRGLTLIGRQIPVGTGRADLLGIDEDGRMVVFELKREKLTRDAVAQVLDYCACLEVMSDSEIARLIEEQSGKAAPPSTTAGAAAVGIPKISDFAEWYGSRSGESIRPIRMVLVGLGIDPSAERMVAYLTDRDVEIGIVTFHGFVQGHNLLLARQVQSAKRDRPNNRRSSRLRNVLARAAENGVAEIWQDATESLDYCVRSYYTQYGMTYLQRTTTLPDDVRVRGSHSVTIARPPGKIRVTLYPAAVDFGRDHFEDMRIRIPFRSEPPPNAPPTRRAKDQWYCLLDEAAWRAAKPHLVGFVRKVRDLWQSHEAKLRDETDDS